MPARPIRAIEARKLADHSPASSAAPAESDEQIVARILAGAGSDFELLVRRHQGAIYSFLLRMLRDPEEALDMTQEVFLKVFCSLERFDPQYRFTTWMYRIASNAAIDLIRKRKNSITLPLEVGPSDGRFSPREVASTGPTPDQFVQARETRTRLEEALSNLPEQYREVLLLRHQGERRYDEIAEITGLPIGTVKNRIFRAREMLRRVMPS